MGNPRHHTIRDRSMSSFVEAFAQLLRAEVKTLKERQTKILKERSGSTNKIVQIAALLRQKVHEIHPRTKKILSKTKRIR
jgi:hypothetical protein